MIALRRWAAVVGLVALLLLRPGHAAPTDELRWAVQADVQTLDPHALLHLPSNALLMQVYEGLVRYDTRYQVEPALARRWHWVGPLQLRFELRPDVRFHDGSVLTADDVVFSIERLRQPGAQLKVQLDGVRSVIKRDAQTVDLFLERPQPLLLRNLVDVKIMSQRWTQAQPEGEVRLRAMGTGPYRLRHWLPDKELLLEAHEAWWDRASLPPHPVRRVRLLPLRSDATRTAALTAGDVDLVTDLPPQDVQRLRQNPALRVQVGPELRTLYVAFQLGRHEHPLADRRVREALSLAVDRAALRDRLLFGLARPAALLVAPGIHGHDPALDQPEPQRLDRARQRLAEAGWPRGFEFEFYCPNNRYARDEAVCQALVQMWAQVGVTAHLVSQPMAQHMRAIQAGGVPAYLYGWTAPNLDAQFTLQALAHTPNPDRSLGSFNHQRLSDPALDRLIDQLAVESDPARRQALAGQALGRLQQEVWLMPLYHTVRAWALRRDLQAPHRADERPELRWMSWQAPASGASATQ